MNFRGKITDKQGIEYLENLPTNVKEKLQDLYKSKKLTNKLLGTETGHFPDILRITPKKTGKLRQSAITYNMGNPFKIYSATKMGTSIRFRALNPEDGFNYATMQEVHEYMHYTTEGTGSRYVKRGLEERQDFVVTETIEAICKGLSKGAKSKVNPIWYDESESYDDFVSYDDW